MSYKSLYKKYLMNNSTDFNKMYIDKFESDSTVKFDFYINNYQAFITYDKEIISLVSRIREYDYYINDLINELPNFVVERYLRNSLIDEVRYTNQVEGIISTTKDINDLINEIEKKIKSKNRFEGIVKKYLYLLDDLFTINEPKDIRKLYDDMLYNEIKKEDKTALPDGKMFRKEIVHVQKSSSRIVHTGIYPEQKIIEHMEKAIEILKDSSIDIIIRIAIFHYLFSYIHPFYDGNGRINRFISSSYLCKYLNKIIGFKLSTTINENLSKYLDAFEHTNDIRNRADLTTFVHEFLLIIYNAYESVEKYMLSKINEYNSYMKKLHDMYISGYVVFDNDNIYKMLKVMVGCTIFGDFGVTKSNLCKILDKGRTRVTEYLCMLKNLDFCYEIRSANYYYYKANLDLINSKGEKEC